MLTGGWDFIDKNGRLLRQGGFEHVWDFQEGFALCQAKKGYAFIGKDGRFLNTPLIYPKVPLNVDARNEPIGFGEGIAIMGTRTKNDDEIFIFVDKTGAVTGRIDKTWIYRSHPFSGGLAAVCVSASVNDLSGKWGAIDKSGNTTANIIYDRIQSYSEGLAAVKRGNHWWVIDKTDKP